MSLARRGKRPKRQSERERSATENGRALTAKDVDAVVDDSRGAAVAPRGHVRQHLPLLLDARKKTRE